MRGTHEAEFAEFAEFAEAIKTRARMRERDLMEPITNGEERDAQGRFTAGNRAAAGHARPFAQQAAALRRAFYHAVREEDLRAVARKLIDKAIDGDLTAAKLVLLWTLGKPPEPVWPDATPPGGSEAPPADPPRCSTGRPTRPIRPACRKRRASSAPSFWRPGSPSARPQGPRTGMPPTPQPRSWRSRGLEAMATRSSPMDFRCAGEARRGGR
jgi:hypothetical protein